MSVEDVKISITAGLETMGEATDALQAEDEAASALQARIDEARTAVDGLMQELLSIKEQIATGVTQPLRIVEIAYRDSGNDIISAMEGSDVAKLSTVQYGFEGLLTNVYHVKGVVHTASATTLESAIAGLGRVGRELGGVGRSIGYVAETGRKIGTDQGELACKLQQYASEL